MGTFFEIIHKTTFDGVWEYLHKMYELEYGIYDAYESVYTELCALVPEENKDNILICLQTVKDNNELWTNVFGRIIESDNTDRLNLTYLNWEKWLGFDVDNNASGKMTNQEIVAHCMHEMTYNGFTQGAIASSLRTLEEHISQSERCDYYKQRIANNVGMADERILMDIIGEYVDTNSCFLESLIIDLLKSSKIEEDQLPLIENSFENKEIRKQVYIFKTKRELNCGKLLSMDAIHKLFDLKAFNVLEDALNKKAVSVELLDEFKQPEKGEGYRKIKTVLCEKTNKLKLTLKIDRIHDICKRLKDGEQVECPKCGALLHYYGPGSGYHPGVFCPNEDFWVLEEYR